MNSSRRRILDIQSRINEKYLELLKGISAIERDSVTTTKTEVEYFRKFFPAIESYLNSFRIRNASIACTTREVHQKPIVKFENKRCELGDYFLSTKHYYNSSLVSKRLVIYQIKRRGASGFKIDPNQLYLLSNWPDFTFGRVAMGTYTFRLRPNTLDLGSYWLTAGKSESYFPSIVRTAPDLLRMLPLNLRVIEFPMMLPFHSGHAIPLQLAGRFGEEVLGNPEMGAFADALYRYVGLATDPPKEFSGFTSRTGKSKSFWGVEIVTRTEGELKSDAD